MDTLPEELRILDSNMNALERPPWTRIKPGQSGLSEAGWDRVIVEQVDALSDALGAARLLAPEAKLRVLGKQIDAVDVLLAETVIDLYGKPAFRRFVLVEDKLLENPEARRKVLAQIVEYSERARTDWTFERLRAQLPDHAAWLDEQRAKVAHSLLQGEFLLVIAGDGIDDNLVRLARRFAAQHDPLNLSELCLVSMALYQRGDERIFLPHVVSAVQMQQRELAIRVRVESMQGTPLPAAIERVTTQDATATRGRADVAAFLEDLRVSLKAEMDGTWWTAGISVAKRLAYDAVIDVDGRTTATLTVHFGGWTTGLWSPIQVGLELVSSVSGIRELLASRLAEAKERKLLPDDAAVTMSGRQSFAVLTPVTWNDPGGLDDALSNRLRTLLGAFRTSIEPLVVGQARPDVERFLTDLATSLDPEMREARFDRERRPLRSIEYRRASRDWTHIEFFVWFGADDPTDWSVIHVGAFAMAKTGETLQRAAQAAQAMLDRGELPPKTQVTQPAKRTVSVRTRLKWRDPGELDARVQEAVVSNFRAIRTALEPVLLAE